MYKRIKNDCLLVMRKNGKQNKRKTLFKHWKKNISTNNSIAVKVYFKHKGKQTFGDKTQDNLSSVDLH